MREQLQQALKDNTADYAEIRLDIEEGCHVAYRGKEVESATACAFRGGIVRACHKGGWGIATFDSFDNLGRHVQEACRCARLVGREETRLAELPPVSREIRANLDRDFRGVALDDKLKLMESYNNIVLGAHPRVETSHVNYSDKLRTVYFASSRGSYFMEERPQVTCAFSATARDGSLVQRAFDSAASATTYDAVVGMEDRVLRTAERAAALLKAPKVEGGPTTVILNPLLGGVFIHEAFGHLSEADFLYENPKMKELMHLGREVGPGNLNVVDNGSYARSIGSMTFDDEGAPTSETHLIRNGVLSGYLHSMETAARMGGSPTGNARAIGRGYPPIVRMTNTYICNGDMSVRSLFRGVDRGIYACDFFGGQTQFEMFTFSAAYACRIENGERGELLRDVTLSGNVFNTLHAVDGIADDMKIYQGGGGCGKGGQSPLPVGDGAPHVRIRDIVVGG